MKRASKKFDYERLIKLNHNEIPAKINLETGELIEIKTRTAKSKKPAKSIWLPGVKFAKHYDLVVDWLDDQGILTDMEMRILWKMMRMAKYETNSLEPLSDEFTFIELAEEFKTNRNKIKKVLTKLYDLGAYARFDVKRVDVPYTKFWVLNPYLCFRGSEITDDISKLFKGTVIHLVFEEIKRMQS